MSSDDKNIGEPIAAVQPVENIANSDVKSKLSAVEKAKMAAGLRKKVWPKLKKDAVSVPEKAEEKAEEEAPPPPATPVIKPKPKVENPRPEQGESDPDTEESGEESTESESDNSESEISSGDEGSEMEGQDVDSIVDVPEESLHKSSKKLAKRSGGVSNLPRGKKIPGKPEKVKRQRVVYIPYDHHDKYGDGIRFV